MAKVKYIVVEIDGENVFDRKERLLVAGDTARGDFDEDMNETVEDTLQNHEERIEDLEEAIVDPPEVDTILVSGISWEVLVNDEGNVLTTGA